MRYSITSQQLDHLRKEGTLEFEGIYSQEKIATLKDLLEKAVSLSGRDLERGNPTLFRELSPSMLGQIASQLYRKKHVKLAFTQMLPAFTEIATLEEISSVTEVFGAALIDLETGDTRFLLPETSIDFKEQGENKLLIAFTTEKARYMIQEKDPHTHYLKKLGYASGDRLTDETHPLIHK